MKIVDVICFNGEADLFDLRYNILKDYVDEFIVVEFDETFSGKPKPYYFEQIKDNYEKIRFYPINKKKWTKYYEEACKSSNTEYGKGAEHWLIEWSQKESIKDCLTNLNDDDIVFIGDCDEIWNPDLLKILTFYTPTKLKLQVYTYYLNNKSTEQFWGTLGSKYKNIRNECLNYLRTNPPARLDINLSGWHFTSMAGDLRRKLTDSYTAETYANVWVLNNLDKHIQENKDFLGRVFTYTEDESEWPQYLKDNREKYLHLIKPPHYPAGDGVRQATSPV